MGMQKVGWTGVFVAVFLPLAACCALARPANPVRISGEVVVGRPAPWDKGAPFFNGPNRYGATPGRKFLFTFPVRGARKDLAFSVSRGTLPPGVALDAKTGVLSGRVAKAGDYGFAVRAANAEGFAEREFTLVIGDQARAQTPLMGWTSWNACSFWLNEDFVRRNARELVRRGFAARGYAYVNVDSGWQGLRNPAHALQPNTARFPDIRGMVDEIHSLGLKAGIYSTPMMIAWGSHAEICGFLPGSTEGPPAGDHCGFWGGCGEVSRVREDAAQWAAWGFDYLKYDWPLCDAAHTEEVRRALDATGRDFQLCITTDGQWELADFYPRHAQLLRSSSDTWDDWKVISERCLGRGERWAAKCGRGCWYDLDMLALGPLGIENGRKGPATLPLKPRYANRLTRDEQILHFAMWAFLPTPLQLSWNLEATDDFTYDLVCNEELLALNQDSAERSVVTERAAGGRVWVWSRQLADGTKAWLFANLSDGAQQVEWPLGRTMRLRDPIGNRDLGAGDGVVADVPAHGVRMVREIRQ